MHTIELSRQGWECLLKRSSDSLLRGNIEICSCRRLIGADGSKLGDAAILAARDSDMNELLTDVQ
jgi:hypothetical protein